VSADFRHWSNPEFIDLGGGTAEHLYKNAATPYYRRPDLYLMFPKRFLEQRQWDPQWSAPGISDIVFMTSRDGLHWDRRFREAFIRPGSDWLNWHERAIEVGPGLVPTGPGEMSFYMFEHYHTDSVRIRRCVLREDGLVSLHAGATEGEILTRPLIYQGNRLELNLATSAAGSVRVEIQDAEGTPSPGFELAHCQEIYGDQLSRVVRWQGQANVGLRAGKVIRLRFVLRDADLFSFRFTR
jgi:hypothetical protein